MCSNHKVQTLCVPTTKYRCYVFQPQSTDVMCSNHKVQMLCVPTTKYRRYVFQPQSTDVMCSNHKVQTCSNHKEAQTLTTLVYSNIEAFIFKRCNTVKFCIHVIFDDISCGLYIIFRTLLVRFLYKCILRPMWYLIETSQHMGRLLLICFDSVCDENVKEFQQWYDSQEYANSTDQWCTCRMSEHFEFCNALFLFFFFFFFFFLFFFTIPNDIQKFKKYQF